MDVSEDLAIIKGRPWADVCEDSQIDLKWFHPIAQKMCFFQPFM